MVICASAVNARKGRANSGHGGTAKDWLRNKERKAQKGLQKLRTFNSGGRQAWEGSLADEVRGQARVESENIRPTIGKEAPPVVGTLHLVAVLTRSAEDYGNGYTKRAELLVAQMPLGQAPKYVSGQHLSEVGDATLEGYRLKSANHMKLNRSPRSVRLAGPSCTELKESHAKDEDQVAGRGQDAEEMTDHHATRVGEQPELCGTRHRRLTQGANRRGKAQHRNHAGGRRGVCLTDRVKSNGDEPWITNGNGVAMLYDYQ
ncbi:hypothetical protein FIBSPDRAFT_894857 [Athelia psychrophila]|uniref:Uncharacterized protein n=1 Tax=Athelia psychrophila TaxID=1759441 RepID=A0A166FFE2_9AGAM|nr:hypothetical protein FIBSPDRAFT_894857 [Fibularhizoctonia sp. CBS 109695]